MIHDILHNLGTALLGKLLAWAIMQAWEHKGYCTWCEEYHGDASRVLCSACHDGAQRIARVSIGKP